MTTGAEGRRAVVISLVSTIVFFLLLGFAITRAPGWDEVRRTFFDWSQFKDTLPEISRAFLLNVKIFSIAEVFILVFALLLAVLRSLPGPVFFPLRVLGIAYADFFRGVPTILGPQSCESSDRATSSHSPQPNRPPSRRAPALRA